MSARVASWATPAPRRRLLAGDAAGELLDVRGPDRGRSPARIGAEEQIDVHEPRRLRRVEERRERFPLDRRALTRDLRSALRELAVRGARARLVDLARELDRGLDAGGGRVDPVPVLDLERAWLVDVEREVLA